jgi:hypothetical protein
VKRLALCLPILLFAGSVHASKTYPPRMASELGLDAEPECTICHTDDEGGLRTVTKPFGRSLVSLGLKGAQPAALSPLLERSRDLNIDSDGDQVIDVDELELGTDPNVADATGGGQDGGATVQMICTADTPPELTTGCAMRSPARPSRHAIPLLVAAAVLTRLRRRPRRSPPVRKEIAP